MSETKDFIRQQILNYLSDDSELIDVTFSGSVYGKHCIGFDTPNQVPYSFIDITATRPYDMPHEVS